MARRIEDYALIGDTHTGALVGNDGSIDWLCLPRFDSPACFAALLGTEDHGRWRLAPAGEVRRVERRYREGTLVLETDFETAGGAVRVTDSMPVRDRRVDLVRVVEGLHGRVEMAMAMRVRFDYGRIVPWVYRTEGRLLAVAGPDAIELTADVETRGEGMQTVADFTVEAGDRVGFVLTYFASHEDPPIPVDALVATEDTAAWWRDWSGQCTYRGPHRHLVLRSLITLKALTYAPTGGIVAALTTSLPEFIGGVRNWDYRFCWLRDATLTLTALLEGGYVEEATAWRDWLLRTIAGTPEETQIMYGPAGERRLTEYEVPWLPGYEGSSPVRVGNAASEQFQLDVYGEVMDAIVQARIAGMAPREQTLQVQGSLLRFLQTAWHEPDEGIWEVRGPRRHFTHSKVMAWVAFDRAVTMSERFGWEGPVDRWRVERDAIHREVCERAWDPRRKSFTQSYGSETLDAALLLIPMVGFLGPEDPRVAGTVEAIQRELMRDGFVLRYPTEQADDGLPPGEGAFLPCTFWLVNNLAMLGRRDEAAEVFERLVGLANDVGLLAEEYDPVSGRQVGNFPQAFTHVGLVQAATHLR